MPLNTPRMGALLGVVLALWGVEARAASLTFTFAPLGGAKGEVCARRLAGSARDAGAVVVDWEGGSPPERGGFEVLGSALDAGRAAAGAAVVVHGYARRNKLVLIGYGRQPLQLLGFRELRTAGPCGLTARGHEAVAELIETLRAREVGLDPLRLTSRVAASPPLPTEPEPELAEVETTTASAPEPLTEVADAGTVVEGEGAAASAVGWTNPTDAGSTVEAQEGAPDAGLGSDAGAEPEDAGAPDGGLPPADAGEEGTPELELIETPPIPRTSGAYRSPVVDGGVRARVQLLFGMGRRSLSFEGASDATLADLSAAALLPGVALSVWPLLDVPELRGFELRGSYRRAVEVPVEGEPSTLRQEELQAGVAFAIRALETLALVPRVGVHHFSARLVDADDASLYLPRSRYLSLQLGAELAVRVFDAVGVAVGGSMLQVLARDEPAGFAGSDPSGLLLEGRIDWAAGVWNAGIRAEMLQFEWGASEAADSATDLNLRAEIAFGFRL